MRHAATPARLAMAACAVGAERALMHVVVLVALDATSGRLGLDRRRDVTRLAGLLRMCAVQIEARVAAVVEATRRPARDAVAIAARGAASSPVIVVPLVTRDAVGRELFLRRVLRVAGPARRTAMRAPQREARLRAMIERAGRPARGVVAARAIVPQAAPVRVVHPMARDAGNGHGADLALWMAGSARRFGMKTGQSEVGRGVVEVDVSPAFRTMAGAAIVAELCIVGIVCLVTRDAPGPGLSIRGALLVAIGARGTRVRAGELEIRAPVIERLGPKAQDVCVRPEMLRVTGTAGLASAGGEATMQPRPGLHVALHRLVTDEAEIGLRATVEARMAVAAFVGLAGVCAAERAGRHEILEARRERVARRGGHPGDAERQGCTQ